MPVPVPYSNRQVLAEGEALCSVGTALSVAMSQKYVYNRSCQLWRGQGCTLAWACTLHQGDGRCVARMLLPDSKAGKDRAQPIHGSYVPLLVLIRNKSDTPRQTSPPKIHSVPLLLLNTPLHLKLPICNNGGNSTSLPHKL